MHGGLFTFTFKRAPGQPASLRCAGRFYQHLSLITNTVATMQSYVGFGETPTTQVDPTLEACEMDRYHTNVPKKHLGTDADQSDMQVLGRKQELHV